MTIYRDIYEKISASQGQVDLDGWHAAGRTVRLIKLQEEVGEVSQAYIGLIGANARKGVTHDGNDIAKELADVVVTAMVALHDWTDNPERFMKERLQTLLERIRTEGS